MKESTLKKILDLYKDGKISADEAEKMIGSKADAPGEQGSWPDDGKLRIAAFVGRRLLKAGDALCQSLEVTYQGDALNVISYLNLTCGNVEGNASAGISLKCADVLGCVNAGTISACGIVAGSVSAGTSIRCGNIGGHASAGTSITCRQPGE